MQCPHCGYFMSPLDKECLRCRQNGYVAPPSVVPPIGPNAAYPSPQPNYAQPASVPVASAPLPFDLPGVVSAPVAPPSAQPLDLSHGYAAPRPTTPVYTPPQPAPAPPPYGTPPSPPIGPGYRAPNSGPYMPSPAASPASNSGSNGSGSVRLFGGGIGAVGFVILACLRIWYSYERAEERRRNNEALNAHFNATVGRQINNSAAMVEQSRQNAANFTPPPRYTVPQNMPPANNNMNPGMMSGQNSAFQQMQQMQQANQQRMQQMQQQSQQRMQDMQQRMQQHRPGF